MIPYRLYELNDQEFEELVIQVCMRILGTGTFKFATGPDGGRDGRFTGTAKSYPSESDPLKGKFIIQAKHTTNAAATCSDGEFLRIVKEERPRIVALAAKDELEHYLLFTNRRLAANMAAKLRKGLLTIPKLKSADLLARETINSHLIANKEIWQDLHFDTNLRPFRVNPDDLVAVMQGFQKAVARNPPQSSGATNFEHTKKEKKNRINKLTKAYYEYLQSDSLPYFDGIKKFLEDPRNEFLRTIYHDAADELKGKIITFRDEFEKFDEVLTYLHDEIVNSNGVTRGRKRLVRIFLHYMYFDCDIGQKNA
jgi:ABC-3C protein